MYVLRTHSDRRPLGGGALRLPRSSSGRKDEDWEGCLPVDLSVPIGIL